MPPSLRVLSRTAEQVSALVFGRPDRWWAWIVVSVPLGFYIVGTAFYRMRAVGFAMNWATVLTVWPQILIGVLFVLLAALGVVLRKRAQADKS